MPLLSLKEPNEKLAGVVVESKALLVCFPWGSDRTMDENGFKYGTSDKFRQKKRASILFRKSFYF